MQHRPSIALLLDHVVGEYQEGIRLAVEAAARARGMNLLSVIGRALDAPRANEAAQNAVYDLLNPGNVDAVIVTGVVATHCSADRLSALCERLKATPLCLIGVHVPGVPSLSIDNRLAMRLVVEHFLEHGCRRIAFVRGPRTSPEAEDRFGAYAECLHERGLPLEPELILDGDFTVPGGTRAVQELLKRGVAFDALIAANDGMAIGGMDVLRQAGLRIPKQVLVGGFDDFPMARFANPSLTTVRQSLKRLGEQAVALIADALAGRPVPERQLVPSELMVRQSCGCGYRVALRRHSLLPPSPNQEPLALLKQRAPALRRLIEQNSRLSTARLDPWLTRLFAALEADIAGESGRFLAELEDVLDLAAQSQEIVEEFHGVIAILRAELRGTDAEGRSVGELDELWHAAAVLIGVASARTEGRGRLASEYAADLIRDSIERLSTTLSHAALKAGLLDLLPGIHVTRALLALYDADDPRRLRCFFAIEGGSPVTPPEPEYRASELLPGWFSPADGQLYAVVMPLTFEGEHLGLCALEGGISGPVSGMLREQISASLKGAVLLESVVKEVARRERAERAQLHGELAVAQRIQTAILPAAVESSWLSVAGQMLPAVEVGGDYYDVLPAPDVCWFGIGDVTGHGLRAGLVMLMLQSMIAALVQRDPEADPRTIVSDLNAALYRNVRSHLALDDYATLSVLRLTRAGQLSWAGAHEDLIVLRARTGTTELFEPLGTWVGARADIRDVTETRFVELDPGDRFVLYTDGLIEARNGQGELFGLERVRRIVESEAQAPPEQVCRRLVEAARDFAAPQLDDISVVVVQYAPGSLPAGEAQS